MKKICLSSEPHPITETTNPCVRKKNNMVALMAPVKDVVKKLRMAEEQAAASMAPSTSAARKSTFEELLALTENWPDRSKLPSVRDILQYKRELPSNVAPAMVAKLAAHKFQWTRSSTVTPDKYVKGVLLGHDYAMRSMIDHLNKLLLESPNSPQDAQTQLSTIKQFVRLQNRPPTPPPGFDE